MDQTNPFIRLIQPEEMWLYKYPMTNSYVPACYLWLLVFCVPVSLILYDYMKNKDKMETSQAVLSLSLNYGLNGFLTTFFKNIVGRPRPDFYYRCFPDGIGNDRLECTGNIRTIMEGRKSFPSGHSSFAFASMVFVSLYLSGKLHVFNTNGRGQTWRLLVVIFPLVLASAIAISRTCDYHHHWQDICAGAILGSVVSYLCYRQYFPRVNCISSDLPYVSQDMDMKPAVHSA